MAQESHLSRYHPAVLSLAGIAAAYGTYALFTAYVNRPAASSLHRSNAVHRPRRERGQRSIQWEQPTAEAPLGQIVIQQGQETYVLNMATTPIPSAEQLRSIFGSNTEATHRDVQIMALDMILTACYVAVTNASIRSDIERLGFGNLVATIGSRDEDRIRQAAWSIPEIMHLDTIGAEHVDHAVDSLLSSERWASGAGSGSDDDVIDPAETEEIEMLNPPHREPSQGLRGLLYYIAEDDAKRKAYEHRGIHCEECGQMPIKGVRWHCLNCPDFDLCTSCEAHARHPKTHVFSKIQIPLPILSQPTKEYRLWYPGDPRKLHSSLEHGLKKRLCHDYGFEEPQMDAFYDQFTCIANVPWDQDPNKVQSAIDRRAFNKAFTSERWPDGLSSNALYDRMFAFYDTDNNGVIGFEEFISGLSYLRGPRRFATLQRALEGYDVDGDGYVKRADFLRILRAKFNIQKQLVTDCMEGQAQDITLASTDTLRSSQPISSIFAEESIPPGETRRPRGKQLDAFGDLLPAPGMKSILDDEDPFIKRNVPAHERLRTDLSRLEEIIYGTHDEEDVDDMDQVDGNQPATGEPVNGDAGQGAGPSSQVHVIEDVGVDIEEPYLQDALWQITEEGFNELLDPLFKKREAEDYDVENTRVERKKWRKEIDEEIAAERQFREDLAATAASDPLLATAAGSFGLKSEQTKTPPPLPDREPAVSMRENMVPTDWESLERREAAISDTSLDDLLNSLGAGVRIDAEPSASASSPRAAARGSSTIWNGSASNNATSPLATEVFHDEDAIAKGDLTLPQNKPNTSADAANANTDDTTSTATPETKHYAPSKQRLQHLARLDELEREMDERGGPGRLSYDEIERITVAENRGELRGLVKSWLEWASF